MAGRRRSSFRFGDLAEHLGLLLLKGIAAVAEVSRQEDVGLDAVASLLRRDDDGNCYAEDTFVVQLKSESVEKIEYEEHELTWFLGQTQPMFVGHVSLQESRISLYSTIHVNQAVLAMHAKKVTIRLGPSNIPGFYPGSMYPWNGGDDEGVTVWLGHPVLQWTLADIVEKTWLQTTYELLKRFLALVRCELDLLSLGQWTQLEWTTNSSASIKSSMLAAKFHPDDLQSVVDQCSAGLRALFLVATATRDSSGVPMMVALINLVRALRGAGATVDAGFFESVGGSWLARFGTGTTDAPQRPRDVEGAP
jgi:hypothetical protein